MLVAFTLFSILGKKLELFSEGYFSKSKALKNYKPLRLLVHTAAGFTWSLAKIHCPGLETAITYGFDNKVGYVLRPAYWKARVARLGKDVRIDVGAKAINWHNITIGDNSWIDRNVFLIAGKSGSPNFEGPFYLKQNRSFKGKRGELIIGKGCHIEPNVVIQSIGGVEIGDYSGVASGAKIYTLSNHYRNLERDDGIIYKFTPLAPPKEQSFIEGPVVFQGNNAIGLNSVVLPGVTIGKNSWVGICSYVIKDIPPNSIAIGCPAQVVKRRFKGTGGVRD